MNKHADFVKWIVNYIVTAPENYVTIELLSKVKLCGTEKEIIDVLQTQNIFPHKMFQWTALIFVQNLSDSEYKKRNGCGQSLLLSQMPHLSTLEDYNCLLLIKN